MIYYLCKYYISSVWIIAWVIFFLFALKFGDEGKLLFEVCFMGNNFENFNPQRGVIIPLRGGIMK